MLSSEIFKVKFKKQMNKTIHIEAAYELKKLYWEGWAAKNLCKLQSNLSN